MNDYTNFDGKVSIIVPCYNSERYLEFCIESIIKQTYRNIEIILVDDCSKDNTRQIIEKYEKEDNRIKVVYHEHNEGLSVSRDDGFQNSSGEWVFFSDHDDVMNPQAIELLIAGIDDETDIIHGGAICIDSMDAIAQYKWKVDDSAKVKNIDKNELIEDLSNCGILWSKLYRRELLIKANTFQYKNDFPLTYFEDSILPQALVIASRKIKRIENGIYISRYHAESTSHRNSKYELPYCVDQLKAFEITLGWYKPNKFLAHGIEVQLLQAIKVWYMIDKFDKSQKDVMRYAENIFVKWFAKYKSLKGNKNRMSKIVIYLFAFNKKLCCKLVCGYWFNKGRGYRLRSIKN